MRGIPPSHPILKIIISISSSIHTSWVNFIKITALLKVGFRFLSSYLTFRMQNFANGDHREITIMTLRFFSLCLTLKKSRNSFLQNFANGGHCEIAIVALRFFSSCLTVKKKSKFIFAKFRKWWPSRIGIHCLAHHAGHCGGICHRDIMLFSTCLALKKIGNDFCKISRMVAITNVPSWVLAFFCHAVK